MIEIMNKLPICCDKQNKAKTKANVEWLESMMYRPLYPLRSLLLLVVTSVLVLKVVVVSGGVLILLVLADEVVHVALCLGELHLVHSLSGVPVEEGFPAEHGGELLGDALEHILNGGRVADEGGGHLESFGRDIADRGLDVVGDPLHEVRRVLVLNVEHLLVHLFGAHPAPEHGRRRQIASMARVRSAHHVLGVEHLLSQFGHRQCSVLLRAARGQRRESRHKEMESRKWHQIHRQFPQIAVQLTRESQAARNAAYF